MTELTFSVTDLEKVKEYSPFQLNTIFRRMNEAIRKGGTVEITEDIIHSSSEGDITKTHSHKFNNSVDLEKWLEVNNIIVF